MGEAKLGQHSEKRMREMRIRQLRWRAFEYAAVAAAIDIGRVIPVGDIDLTAEYKVEKLEEIGRALRLQKSTAMIPAPACLLVNWSILAQLKVGRPRGHFADESMAQILVADDPIGAQLLDRHWPQIERLAESLMLKGKLSRAEVLMSLTWFS